MPAYPAITAGIQNTQVVAEFDNFAGHVVLRYGEYNDVGIYLIDAPHLYGREGNPYHDAYYNDYGDNYKRFALLGWVGGRISHRFRQLVACGSGARSRLACRFVCGVFIQQRQTSKIGLYS